MIRLNSLGITFKHIKNDLPASIIVFFVAVPLCLGIALASGAPLFSGIIAGFVGGIIVGAISGSAIGVSGPAAGLAVIVISAISALNGDWSAFLAAVVLAGFLQLLLGYAKAGFIAYFFPSSVIKGMLTGIGLLIILKQFPHFLGWDKDAIGDDEFFQADGQNTLSELIRSLEFITPGALLIGIVSLTLLIIWEKILSPRHKIFQLIQGPLVVVVLGIIFNMLYQSGHLPFSLNADQLVKLPVSKSMNEFVHQFTFPNWKAFQSIEVYKIAIVLCIVGSLETLLSVEASDKLDNEKRITPTNRELKAQGIGNIISGLIGGLPITQVIVRSSANVNFGAKTKLSAILHGIFLLISAIFLAGLLNKIPLACLASILLMVGYKLAKPSLFKEMYKLGWDQFMPFTATVIAILFSDLLKGITIGILFGIFYTLRQSYRNTFQSINITKDEFGNETHHIVMAEEISFFNKAKLIETLDSIPHGSLVIIDCTKSKSIEYDVRDVIKNFESNAKTKNIRTEKINLNL